MDFFPYEIVAYRLHDDGDEPAEGVGNKQEKQASVQGKCTEDPDQSDAYGSDDGQNHGNKGVSHTAHTAGNHIHDTAQEVGKSRDGKNFHAVFDDISISGINSKQKGAE